MPPFSRKYQKMQITPIRVGFHMHFRRIQMQVTDMIVCAIGTMEPNVEGLLPLLPTYKNVEFWLFIILRLWSYMSNKERH